MGNNVTLQEKFGKSQFKQNSIILITGASSGLGEELAIQYSKRKTRLFICARSKSKLEEVVKRCRQNGSECEYEVCDVTQEEQCKNVVDKCIKKYGGLDLLYLNAGINGHIYFKDIKDFDIYEKLMKTNYFGYIYPTRYALPHLKQSNGQIVVISSASGIVGIPMRTAYCASKFAVTGFFEALRIELSEINYKIDITLICPPSINSPMREKDLAMSNDSHPTNVKAVEESPKEDKRLSVEDSVKYIMVAADRKIKRVYFPNSWYLGVYLKPFFSNYVDEKIKAKAKL